MAENLFVGGKLAPIWITDDGEFAARRVLSAMALTGNARIEMNPLDLIPDHLRDVVGLILRGEYGVAADWLRDKNGGVLDGATAEDYARWGRELAERRDIEARKARRSACGVDPAINPGGDRCRGTAEKVPLGAAYRHVWGDYKGLCGFVAAYLAACEEHPDAHVRTCR